MKQLLFVISACLLLTSCAGNSQDRSNEASQTLRLNMYTEPPSLDPARASDTTSGAILEMVFDGLYRIGPGEKPQPAVAESVAVSDDGKTYTFTLRPSHWVNGDAVTAQDFAFAWKRLLDPKFPGDMAYNLYILKNGKAVKEGKLPLDELGVKTPDDQTLVVELEHPSPYFLEMVSGYPFFPVHQQTIESNPNWAYEAGPAYITNGPFMLELWKHHNEITVVKNPTYWDHDSVKLNKINISLIEDANTELSLFEKGALDWTGNPVSIGIPTDALPMLAQSGQLQHRPYAAVYLYQYNTSRGPLQNANFRKALAYAVNRQAIVDNILQGGEKPATGFVSPPMQLKDSFFKDHDVKEAQRLFQLALEELHMTRDQLPTLRLSYNSSEGHHKIAQAIQQQWNEVLGIKVALENAEWKVHLDNIGQGNFDIARVGWHAGFNDAVNYLELFKYPKGMLNHTGWYNEKYSALLQEADYTLDPEKRRDLLLQAETILMDEMPVLPMHYHTAKYLINPRLHDVYFSPTGEVDFKRAYFGN